MSIWSFEGKKIVMTITIGWEISAKCKKITTPRHLKDHINDVQEEKVQCDHQGNFNTNSY